MNVRTTIPLLALLAALGLLAACNGGNGAPQEAAGLCPSMTPAAVEVEGELTVEELTDLVAEAITCPGYAVHLSGAGEWATEVEDEAQTSYWETQMWVDADHNLGRMESYVTGVSEDTRETVEAEGEELPELPIILAKIIVRSDGKYTLDREDERPSKSRPPLCHGPDRTALGLVMDCEVLQEGLEIIVDEDASYRGQRAIALDSEGSDETSNVTFHVYVDGETFLPAGASVDSHVDAGSQEYTMKISTQYEPEFVPLDSLPADFFDPASLGYVEEEP